MKSIEEDVETLYKHKLISMGFKPVRKNGSVNSEIDNALKTAESKSGGAGNNYPDIRFLIDNGVRRIPVMVEAKGKKGDLIRISDGSIVQVTTYSKDTKTHKAGDKNYSAIMKYAVNGALHYALAVLNNTSYEECIAIGINGYPDENGTETAPDGTKIRFEESLWYISKANQLMPKKIEMGADALKNIYSIVDSLSLTSEEIEAMTKKTEEELDKRLRTINQVMQDTLQINVNYRVDLISGMIMAGIGAKGVQPLVPEELHSYDGTAENDGRTIMNRIESVLEAKKLPPEKKRMICGMLSNVFVYDSLWKPENGESKLKKIYLMIYRDIMPIFRSEAHIDFTGKLFNVLNEWVQVPDGDKNDVVLTPRYVTDLMVRLCRVDMNSYVQDYCTGSGSFLVSSMKEMIHDARSHITDPNALMKKENSIKMYQLLGIEKLADIYMLAVLNMMLMGDGSSHIYHGDSMKFNGTYSWGEDEGPLNPMYPATVSLCNPPYSADSKGLVFMERMLSRMKSGYAAVIIQENAGSGQGKECAQRILEHNTLTASIHMPTDLFGSKASVQTAIYVFEVGKPHNKKQPVRFIDFSNDGYTRQNRKKSSQEVNLRDTDHAKERYEELVNVVLYGHTALHYYKEGETYFEDTISLSGDDWTFAQHKKIDTTPTEEDFMKTIGDYLAFKVEKALKGGDSYGA